ncbi:peptidylprolyl isomerase [Thalassolituus marinus]|uniref:Peptidyl-prolyl cis-trans isomerase n=1 Tax=Thalassolituus marinus TaxID=671053 RepID=A0ABS7ZRY5_9GAMM|nr:peptidylprolyl isomerase [Thalassolituus marinus]MCA6063285.1 peptidylprolyl isomerase [Thalassolituus marinus]
MTLINKLLTTATLSTALLVTGQALAEDLVGIKMTTSEGVIELALDREKAPLSVENFITYVESGHYNGTIYHRVIKNFMIQGGGFSEDMRQKATLPPIKNEAENGLKNERGTIAMARTRSVDSATSQFFINVVDNKFLDHGQRDFGYAVFGKVTSGMDVVDAIAATKTGPRDVPITPIVIQTVEVINDEPSEQPAEK